MNMKTAKSVNVMFMRRLSNAQSDDTHVSNCCMIKRDGGKRYAAEKYYVKTHLY